MSQLTGTESEAAAYERPSDVHTAGDSCDAKIQRVGFTRNHRARAKGKEEGDRLIAVAKSSDLILMVLDACKSEAANSSRAHKDILTRELERRGLLAE